MPEKQNVLGGTRYLEAIWDSTQNTKRDSVESVRLCDRGYVMPEIPRCPNSVGGGCPYSNMKVELETDEFWSFKCHTCKVISVVSKDGIRDKSKFEVATKRMEQQRELDSRWQKRKRIFT